MQTFWTDERVTELVALVRSRDHSAAEIAAILGDKCSKNMVISKVARVRSTITDLPMLEAVRSDGTRKGGAKRGADKSPRVVSDRPRGWNRRRTSRPSAPSVYPQTSPSMAGKRKPWLKATLPSSKAEYDRLIAEAVKAGRVTKCPPGYAMGSLQLRTI